MFPGISWTFCTRCGARDVAQRIPLSAPAPDFRLEEQGNDERDSGSRCGELVCRSVVLIYSVSAVLVSCVMRYKSENTQSTVIAGRGRTVQAPHGLRDTMTLKS